MNELELLAVGVHGTLSAIHAHGSIAGSLSAAERGAGVVLHCLGLVHHAIDHDLTHVSMHVAGIVALFASSRALHALAAGYDGLSVATHAARVTHKGT